MEPLLIAASLALSVEDDFTDDQVSDTVCSSMQHTLQYNQSYYPFYDVRAGWFKLIAPNSFSPLVFFCACVDNLK